MFKKFLPLLKKRIIIIAILLIISVIFIINVIIVFQSKGYVDTEHNLTGCTVIVLGARVYSSGRISDIYADRLLSGADIVRKYKAQKIIVSGDNRESHNRETSRGKAFLEKQGIPAAMIFEDEKGVTTFDSIQNFTKDRNKSVVIVTQGYHLYRAVYIARSFGISAYGVSSDRQRYLGIVWFQLREVFARIKAFWMIMFIPQNV
jgi:SanA protein